LGGEGDIPFGVQQKRKRDWIHWQGGKDQEKSCFVEGRMRFQVVGRSWIPDRRTIRKQEEKHP